MDLDKIQNRIQHDQYSSVEDIIEDLGQMFENAVMFNDPNSQIHKVRCSRSLAQSTANNQSSSRMLWCC